MSPGPPWPPSKAVVSKFVNGVRWEAAAEMMVRSRPRLPEHAVSWFLPRKMIATLCTAKPQSPDPCTDHQSCEGCLADRCVPLQLSFC